MRWPVRAEGGLGIAPYAMICTIIKTFINQAPDQAVQTALTIIGLALLVVLMKYILEIGSFVVSHLAAFDLLYRIRARLIRHLGTLSAGFWLDHNSDGVRKIIQEDVEALEEFLGHHIPDLVSQFVLPIATLIYLGFVDWRLALVTLIPLPIDICFMMKRMGMGKNSRRKKSIKQYHCSFDI